MADDSTFGSGLNVGGDASAAGPAAPDSGNTGPAPATVQPAAPQGFGSAFGGPSYTPPDPNASALDQSADTLQQRIKRANSVATNPLLQFFNPEGVQAARNFVPAATEQLQKIRQQQAGIKAGRAEASSLGLNPGDAPDEATHDDRVAVAVNKSLQGDLRSFKGLSAVDPQRAASIQDQVHEAASAHLSNAQLAFDSLSSMQNQGQYEAKVKQLRQEGTLTGLEALGLKVPPTFDAFNSSKSAEGEQLRQARVSMENLKAKIDERSNGTPMSADEQKTYKGRLTTESGQEINNGTWSRINGKRVYAVNGQGDIRDLGQKFNYANADQRKQFADETAAAVPKEDIEKYRGFNRTYQIAEPTAEQKKRGDVINSSPQAQQAIAEGLASMLRGGSGGANIGLLKLEKIGAGATQNLMDSVKSNYAGAINTITGKDLVPYLTKMTSEQKRQVLDEIKQYNDKSISDRVAPIARRAGELGLDASALGLGKGEVQGVEDAIKAGTQSTIDRFSARSRAIGGGDGGIFLDNPPPVLVTHPEHPPGSVPDVPPPVKPQPGAPAGGPAGPSSPAPAAPQQPGPGPAAQPPVGGPTPGRYGLPPGMPLNSPQALDAAANRTIQIESGFKPGQNTGSYKGLGQWSDEEMKRHGITDPNDLKQTQDALKADITARSAKLQKDGLPVTASNVYLMHQQGEAGLEAHLKNPTGTAWQNIRQYYKSDAVAKQAVWGNMTPEMKKQFPGGVDSVKSGDFTRLWEARYNGTDNTGTANIADAAGRRSGLSVAGRTAPRATEQPDQGGSFWSRLNSTLMQGVPEDQRATAAADVGNSAVQNAPAIGGTLGAVAGGPVGGAVGGGAGQALKDYLQGNPQSPTKIAKEAALSGVLGVASEARPVLAAVARPVGAGAVNAGATAAEGGDASDIGTAAIEGTGEAAGGELFGRSLGMIGHKFFSLFAPDAQKAVQAAAKDLHEANETLKTEQPTLPGAEGKTSPNPKYDAAQAAKEKAEARLKEMMPSIKPEEAAYAHKVSTTDNGNIPVPKQEAQAARPGALEGQKIGQGYQQLENEVGAAGVGAPKATPKLPDGPIAAVENKKVSATHQELAEHVEAAITAPAPNWQTKWNQLKDARSQLLQAERDALGSTAPGKSKIAADMRTLADTVRKQQEKVATYVFGAKDGPAFMDRLKVLDTRYRNLMDVTNGGDLAKAAALTGEEGRDAEKKFVAFAHDDPQAIAAYRAMRGVKGDPYDKTVPWTVAAEGIPGVGKVIKAVKLGGMLREWARERTAGNPSKFADFVKANAGNAEFGKALRNVGGAAGSRMGIPETPVTPGVSGVMQ